MTPKLIVSLTTVESRLRWLPLVIERLSQQTLLPDLIVLWVGRRLRKRYGAAIERDLARFRPLVEVRYAKDVGPATKLLPSLKAFPGAIIVTIDDDKLVPKDWLAGLYKAHLEMPEPVLCYRARMIRVAKGEGFHKYGRWPLMIGDEPTEPSHFLLATGACGVLYPPHCLSPRVDDDALRSRACPTADDLWFKAMAILRGTPVVKIGGGFGPKRFRRLPSHRVSPLWSTNRHTNADQWHALDRALGLRELLLRETRLKKPPRTDPLELSH